jgi:hypothetical protein
MNTGALVTSTVRTQWFTEEVKTTVAGTLRKRGDTAADHLKKKIVRNLSQSGGIKGLTRSLPGQFPREQTSALKNSITVETSSTGSVTELSVGTPLFYGVVLETRRNRSFLLRTFNEEVASLRRTIGG